MGDNFWSVSGCNLNGHTRPDVWWYGRPGLGCWYYRPNAASDKGPWWVSGPIHANFAAGGHECGGAGAPTDAEKVCNSGPYRRWQRFEGGRFVVDNANVAHYHHAAFSSPCLAGVVEASDLDSWLDEELDVPDPPIIDAKGKALNGGKVRTRKVKRRDLPVADGR